MHSPLPSYQSVCWEPSKGLRHLSWKWHIKGSVPQYPLHVNRCLFQILGKQLALVASRSVRVFFNCFSKYLVSCPFPFPCLMMLHSTLTFISHVKHILEESFHHFWPLLLPPWGNILHIYCSSSLSVVMLEPCPDSTHCSALLLIRRGAPPYLWNNLSWESKHYRTHDERESMLWKTQYWSRLRMCSHSYWVKLKCKLFNGVISQSKDWHNHRNRLCVCS